MFGVFLKLLAVFNAGQPTGVTDSECIITSHFVPLPQLPQTGCMISKGK